MHFGGGAQHWLDRRSRDEPNSESDSVELEDEPDEVPVDDSQEGGHEKTPAKLKTEDTMHYYSDATIRSAAGYEAVKEIFMPSNAVKSKTGEVLLKRQKGTFMYYRGIDLDAEELDVAGFMAESPNQTHTNRLQFAERLTEGACGERCGGAECQDSCRVRAFVVVEGYGTNFFFGSYEEVVKSVRDSCACEVFVWDELPVNSMPSLQRMLDGVLQGAPGLAMEATELKTVPGQVGCINRPTSKRMKSE